MFAHMQFNLFEDIHLFKLNLGMFMSRTVRNFIGDLLVVERLVFYALSKYNLCPTGMCESDI